MTTGSLAAADLLVAVLGVAAWLGGGAAAAARRRPLALGLAAVAVLATLARASTITALALAGWWFAAEKVVIAAPLSIAALAVAAPRLLRLPHDIRSVAIRLLFAGYAQASGLLVTVLHGYPASPATGLLAVAGCAAATAVSWRVVGSRPSRTATRGTLLVAAVALLAGTGLATAPAARPGVPHDHGYPAVQAVGEPSKRITLTAATTTVKVAGRDVAAWAFNGQVPGPELTATVGDVLEVTLRNRDIGRGVTLHWHGYDVPNSQDGVPDVTQAAVLPGQAFVYRFRADQAGTYWYHTHSVSDQGVRMGLYGVLVVRPGPVTGVDVTVPVHTLSGIPLPTPREEHVAPGTAMRLRLINTDSATHRYALAGTTFQVAAIDGADLNGPTLLVDTAIPIPAGGRYDLVFTAPATPVGLFVDGRLAYSTGPVSAQTGAWPVLDPLTYGAAEPAPWERFRQAVHPRPRPRSRPAWARAAVRAYRQRRGRSRHPARRRRPRRHCQVHDREPVLRRTPVAPARAPRAGAVPRRQTRDRQSTMARLVRRATRRGLGGRVSGRQPRNVGEPLPQPGTRRRRDDAAPDLLVSVESPLRVAQTKHGPVSTRCS